MTNKQVKMEQHVEEPRVCQELDVLKTSRPDPAESPPPNCAICLGTCTNKCFTDCCLHQFCFSCLLEWSKIKAECPLCKQPFKSIIYNIKSNLEYEEHIITNPERENQEDLLTLSDPSEYLFLPNGPRPQRHFQYRTTFTLEPGGEFAIQQLLLSHPRTNSISFPSDRYPYIRFNSSTHSVDQRRTIYIENWWVDPQSDVTGRFRVCSPHFFRENPAQAHRIIPWLNRELTSLINHTLIYPVQQEILDMLCQYPILSTQFRSHIVQHLGARTDHFIHEFYNFVRSPYDMIGYDRHATYRRNRPPPVYDLSDEDSDVHVVDSPENDDCVFVPNRTPEVILIDSESSGNDSDVIMRTPTPPPIVDLVNDTTSEDEQTETPQSPPPQQLEQLEQLEQLQQLQEPVVEFDRIETRSPQLPIKIRLKRSKSSAEICKNYKHKEKRRFKRSHSSSASSDNDNDSSSTEGYKSSSKSSSSDYYEYVMKKKKSKLSNKKHSKSDAKYLSKNSKYRKKQKSEAKAAKKSKRNSSNNKKSKKQKKSKRRDSEKRHKNIKIEKSDTSTSASSYKSDMASSCSDDGGNYRRRKKPRLFYEIKTETSVEQTPSQTDTSQYDLVIPDSYPAPGVAASSSASTVTSSAAVATFSSSTETSLSPAVTAASTFNSTNLETNSDHWSTTSIASSCPSSILPQDLGVAGPSNCVSVQSMVVVKDKDGSLWCRSNYQPSKRFGLYRPDLNRSSENSSDTD